MLGGPGSRTSWALTWRSTRVSVQKRDDPQVPAKSQRLGETLALQKF